MSNDSVSFDGSEEDINVSTALNMMKSGSVRPVQGGGGVVIDPDSDMQRRLLPFNSPGNVYGSLTTLPFIGREGAVLMSPGLMLVTLLVTLSRK